MQVLASLVSEKSLVMGLVTAGLQPKLVCPSMPRGSLHPRVSWSGGRLYYRGAADVVATAAYACTADCCSSTATSACLAQPAVDG